ncbi:MAG: leucyl/phenylalanyl-tRNA--protein transferase [Methyloceanibacter sp.]|uniref:leucyl/phenylalanyl-tRNA--protein transferase n=1 Tax=Methyloceanibacter sp. TaxID=1965321 RepID=UPI003EDF6C2E
MSGRQNVWSEVSRNLVSSGLYSRPAALALLAKQFIGFGPKLPDPEQALRHPEGLCGSCSDLNVPTMIAAYAKGLYPEANKWWAPAERMVSFPENAYVSQRVWRLLQTRTYGVTFDEDFAGVMRACAPEPALADAFAELNASGYAHSVEVWDRAGRLAGGLFGLAVGQAFFTEKLFSRERDAVNVGFVTLSCHLQHWGFALNDGKRMSGQLSQLGFSVVPRFAFNGLLSKATQEPTRMGKWTVERGLDAARWNPKVAGTGRATPGAQNPFTLSS